MFFEIVEKPSVFRVFRLFERNSWLLKKFIRIYSSVPARRRRQNKRNVQTGIKVLWGNNYIVPARTAYVNAASRGQSAYTKVLAQVATLTLARIPGRCVQQLSPTTHTRTHLGQPDTLMDTIVSLSLLLHCTRCVMLRLPSLAKLAMQLPRVGYIKATWRNNKKNAINQLEYRNSSFVWRCEIININTKCITHIHTHIL